MKPILKYIQTNWLDIILIMTSAFFFYYEIGMCFLLLGCYLLLYSINRLLFLHSIYNNGLFTDGSILEYKSDSDGVRYPIISFETENGIYIEKEAYINLDKDLMKIKSLPDSLTEVTPVLYLKEAPEKFVVFAPKRRYYRDFIILLIIGILFSIFAVAELLSHIEVN